MMDVQRMRLIADEVELETVPRVARMASQALRDQRFQWFAQGYRAVRPLPADVQEHMPGLLNLLRAVKMARLLRAYATTKPDGDYPEWLTRMRDRHMRWLAAHRAGLRWE